MKGKPDLAKRRNMIARHCKIICREPLGRCTCCLYWARQNPHPGKMLTVIQHQTHHPNPTCWFKKHWMEWWKKKANHRQVTLKHQPGLPIARFHWPKPPSSQQPSANGKGDCEEAECIWGCFPCSLCPIRFFQRCLGQNNNSTIILDKLIWLLNVMFEKNSKREVPQGMPNGRDCKATSLGKKRSEWEKSSECIHLLVLDHTSHIGKSIKTLVLNQKISSYPHQSNFLQKKTNRCP